METQWFVECDPISNEHLAGLLSAHGMSMESEMWGVPDRNGKRHNLWRVPSEFITRLRKAKQIDQDRMKHMFTFFVRDKEGGPVRRADFLEQKKQTSKLKKAKADLQKLRARLPV